MCGVHQSQTRVNNKIKNNNKKPMKCVYAKITKNHRFLHPKYTCAISTSSLF